MDVKRQIEALAAENIALQSIIVGFFLSLKKSPEGLDLVRSAFKFAEQANEASLFRLTGMAEPDHVHRMACIIEDLRKASLQGS